MIKNSKFNQNSKFKIQNFKPQSFPKFLTIVFIAALLFQISSVEAEERYEYYQKSLGVDCAGIGGQTSVPITACQTRNVTPPNDCIRPGFSIEDLCFCCYYNSTPTPAPSTPQPAQPAPAKTGIQFTPQVGGLNYNFDSADKTMGNIAELVKAIYKYAIGIVGILAAVVLMIGGVLWVVAGGNATQIGEAKAWIGASLTGLILALTSYLILYTVNPALVDLQKSEITSVSELKIGCCITKDATGKEIYEGNYKEDDCEKPEKGGSWTQGQCPGKMSCCAYGRAGTAMDDFTICGEPGLASDAVYKDCDDTSNLTYQQCYNKRSFLTGVHYLLQGKCKVVGFINYKICDCN